MESLIGMPSEQLVKLQKRHWAKWMTKVANLSPNACKTITALLADKDARAHDGASLARRKEDIPAHALHTFSSLEEFQAAEADMQALIGQQVLICMESTLGQAQSVASPGWNSWSWDEEVDACW